MTTPPIELSTFDSHTFFSVGILVAVLTRAQVGIRTEIATWAGLPPEHLEKSAVYGTRSRPLLVQSIRLL